MASMKHRSSLVDEIHSLLNPQPTSFEDPEHINAFDDDTHAHIEEFDEENGVELPKKVGLKRDIDLGREGETYRGKIISRKDLNWGADSTSENGQEDESEDREGEESEDKEGENRESEEESQDESEDHMTESDESESSQVQGEDLEALEKEVDAIDEGTQLIQQIPEDEMKKAKQTRNQQILWEECMDMRIRMQKAVLSSNQFPRPNTYELFCKNEGISSAFEKAQSTLHELLNGLIQVQSALVSQNENFPQINDIKTPESRKRPRSEDYWEYLDSVSQRLTPYNYDVIDAWNAKTQIISNANNTFKVLNQTIVQQVKSMMNNEKILQKCHINRSSRIFGVPETTNQETEKSTEKLDFETYDDTDFYQYLLREVINSVQTNDPLSLGRNFLATRNLRTSTKKKIDRRASKGRKIRYKVHPQLTNFMFPLPESEPDLELNALFKSLFGMKPQISDENQKEQERSKKKKMKSNGFSKGSLHSDDVAILGL